MTICVRKGPASILPWTMYQVELDWSFAKLLEVLWTKDNNGEEPECYLSQDMKPSFSNRVQVMMGFNVIECCRINGNFISYIFSDSREEVASPQRSATSVLMLSKQLGFTGGCHLTSGKEYIKTIQTVLFTLQPHIRTLYRRKANFVPLFFSPLLEKGYNNPATHRHKAPPLSQDRLNKLVKRLYVVLAFPVLETAKWKECATATRQLAMNLDEYCRHLQVQSEQQQSRHLSPTPLRFPSDGKSSHISTIVGGSVRTTHLIERYIECACACGMNYEHVLKL